MTAAKIEISVIVPVYSGERYLEALLAEIVLLRHNWMSEGAPVALSELIFVEDAAIDGSSAVLGKISAAESWVTVLHMSRNYGQHPATIAGIMYSSGDWIVTMDEDMQHPPSAIPLLLKKAIDCHADVVYAKSHDGTHQSQFRDISSRLYKKAIEWLTGNRTVSNINSFRLIRGAIARCASSSCIHETYFDVALTWYTDRFESVEMQLRDERYISTGHSGYNLRKLLSHARRMLVSSNLKILRMAALLGFAIVCLSFSVSGLLVFLRLFSLYQVDARGWTSTLIVINMLGGTTIFLIGILLEYVSILVQRVHGRPLFFTIDRSSDEALSTYFSRQR
jgi:polyisoprenyl-phosphate glycosyltransferase